MNWVRVEHDFLWCYNFNLGKHNSCLQQAPQCSQACSNSISLHFKHLDLSNINCRNRSHKVNGNQVMISLQHLAPSVQKYSEIKGKPWVALVKLVFRSEIMQPDTQHLGCRADGFFTEISAELWALTRQSLKSPSFSHHTATKSPLEYPLNSWPNRCYNTQTRRF